MLLYYLNFVVAVSSRASGQLVVALCVTREKHGRQLLILRKGPSHFFFMGPRSKRAGQSSSKPKYRSVKKEWACTTYKLVLYILQLRPGF